MVALSDTPRLTLPIALAGAALAALLAMAFCLALPVWRLEWLVVHSGLPTLLHAAAPPLGRTARLAFALAGGVGAGVIAWAALHLRVGGRKLRLRLPVLVRPTTGAPSVRRADAHPDAPPRAPIRADREFWPVPEGAERELPADLATPLADYDAQAILPVPRSPVRAPAPLGRAAPLAPGERIETFALEHDVPADHAHSIESLLARLESGARARKLARSV